MPPTRIDGSRPQTITDFLPPVANGYACDLNSGIEISADGALTTGVLESGDSGVYTCSSSDLGGDITFALEVFGELAFTKRRRF